MTCTKMTNLEERYNSLEESDSFRARLATLRET